MTCSNHGAQSAGLFCTTRAGRATYAERAGSWSSVPCRPFERDTSRRRRSRCQVRSTVSESAFALTDAMPFCADVLDSYASLEAMIWPLAALSRNRYLPPASV